VVLLHGGGPGASSWSNFRGNIGELSKKYRVIMMDQPGFGKSDRAIYEGERIGAFAARALSKLLKHLGIDKAHLIGNSMGGHVSMKFAIDYPEQTVKLILMAACCAGNVRHPGAVGGLKAPVWILSRNWCEPRKDAGFPEHAGLRPSHGHG